MALHYFFSLDIYSFHGNSIAVLNLALFKFHFAWSHVNACNEVTLTRRENFTKSSTAAGRTKRWSTASCSWWWLWENFTPKWNLKLVWVSLRVSCKPVINLNLYIKIYPSMTVGQKRPQKVLKMFLLPFSILITTHLLCPIWAFILIVTKYHSKSTSHSKRKMAEVERRAVVKWCHIQKFFVFISPATQFSLSCVWWGSNNIRIIC